MYAQRAMANDEVHEVEAIVEAIIKRDSPILADELPLTFAQGVKGLRNCTGEVSWCILRVSLM